MNDKKKSAANQKGDNKTVKKTVATPPQNEDQIYKPPTITRQPSGRSCAIGGRAIFQISAMAVPPAKYQWYHNGQPITGATGQRFMIPKVRQADVGAYTCEAKNFVGSTMSRRVTLMIVQANIPDFVVKPAQLLVKPGAAAHFAVEFVGAKVLNMHQYELQWYCNGRKIRGATKPELDIKHVTAAIAGEFAAKLTLKTNMHAYRISDPVKLLLDQAAAAMEAPAPQELPQEIQAPQATESQEPEENFLSFDTPANQSSAAEEDFVLFETSEAVTPIKAAPAAKKALLEKLLKRVQSRNKGKGTQRLQAKAEALKKMLAQTKRSRAA